MITGQSAGTAEASKCKNVADILEAELQSIIANSLPRVEKSVPREVEWGNYRADPDQAHAYTLFGGRTNQEMLLFFRRNVIQRTDELRWMPELPFGYYILGFRDLVMSDDLGEMGAPDAVSCFLGLVLQKLENQPGCIMPNMPKLLPAIRHVAMSQASFGAAESIYGSFPEKLKRIEALSQPVSG
jgi:hypothetical protein